MSGLSGLKRPPIGRLSLFYRPIASLRADPRNPRQHSRRQIRTIASSIKTFGFLVPILIDGGDRVIAGHGRLLAAKELGLSEVPTIRLEHLTEVQKRAFMIADNRLTEIAKWEDKILAEELRELAAADLNFELEVIGFTMAEIDLRIEGLSQLESKDADPADVLPAIGDKPVSKPGDLWLLGRHRLLCSNSLDHASYVVLFQDEQAAMVFADPPYNVKIDGHVSGLGAVHHREFAMASGEMTEAEFTNFLALSFGLLGRYTTDGSLHYICMDWRHLGETLAAGRGIYGLKNLCVWVKHQAGMGSLYRSQHELVLVFKKGRAPHRNNVELGRHGRHRSNVWHYRGNESFGRPGEEGHLARLHPTVKPVALIADAISDCTARGEIVLDAFIGSGSTILAAERRGRRCYGIEIDPIYTDLAIRRWQIHSGEAARHALTGQLFDEVEHGH
jgi:DNA modification methylase